MRAYPGELGTYYPKRLADEVRAVVERFDASPESLGAALSSDRCDEVRRQIRHWKPGVDLSRRDAKIAMRLCGAGCESDAWNAKAVEAVVGQSYKLGFRLLLAVYQQCYDVDGLRSHLASRAQSRDPAHVPLPQGAADVILREDPVRSIAVDAVESQIRTTELMAAYGVRDSTALSRASQARMLHGATAEWYTELTDDELSVALGSVLASHESIASFLNALVQTCEMSDWRPQRVNSTVFAKAVFEAITQVENLGTPSDHEERWAHVSKAARDLVQWWLTEKEVEGFFGAVDSVPDRRFFWMRASRVIRQFYHYPASKTFAMRIGDWYFVEFGEVGNACYVYDESAFREMKSLVDEWEYKSPGQWKDRSKLKHVRAIYNRQGRFCHSGELRLFHRTRRRVWQRDFEGVIEHLTGEVLD